MRDVADALRIKVPAAKSRLLRARVELRLRLGKRCRDMGAQSPLTRSAAPFHRVARQRAMHPLQATGA